MLEFDLHKYIQQYLPPVLRKERLVNLLYALIYPLYTLWLKFKEWTAGQEYLLNISPTVLQLQEYLNDLYDPVQRRILIKHNNVTGIEIPLESEGYETIYIGLMDETDTISAEIPLEGEVAENYGQFMVFIPLGINTEAVRQTVIKYKLIGKKFTVETLN